MELLSIIITLRPAVSGRLGDNQGRAAHAWWLNQARSRAPDLVAQWRQPNQPRSFTLSGLWTGDEPAWGPLTLRPEQTLSLRLTTLDKPTANLARALLLERRPAVIRLGGADLRVEAATADPNRHPWANQSSYDELINRFLMRGDRLPHAVQFYFSSYTTFQRSPAPDDPHGAGRYALPLPLPELLMRGLLHRWNAFAPVQAPADLPSFCAHRMLISSHQLDARRIKFGGGKGETTAFRGRVRFSLYKCDAYWTGLIHLLAAFSFYASVGGRTTTGLGQCRVDGG